MPRNCGGGDVLVWCAVLLMVVFLVVVWLFPMGRNAKRRPRAHELEPDLRFVCVILPVANAQQALSPSEDTE